jgi:hypothetical protein
MNLNKFLERNGCLVGIAKSKPVRHAEGNLVIHSSCSNTQLFRSVPETGDTRRRLIIKGLVLKGEIRFASNVEAESPEPPGGL